jgi:hypothetical protein
LSSDEFAGWFMVLTELAARPTQTCDRQTATAPAAD